MLTCDFNLHDKIQLKKTPALTGVFIEQLKTVSPSLQYFGYESSQPKFLDPFGERTHLWYPPLQ